MLILIFFCCLQLKEHRPEQQANNRLSSHDTSLTTTPSVNSVASSSGSMSDESLNVSSFSSGQSGAVTSGMSKSSTLDTVIEGEEERMWGEERMGRGGKRRGLGGKGEEVGK